RDRNVTGVQTCALPISSEAVAVAALAGSPGVLAAAAPDGAPSAPRARAAWSGVSGAGSPVELLTTDRARTSSSRSTRCRDEQRKIGRAAWREAGRRAGT